MNDTKKEEYIRSKSEEFFNECPWFSLRKASRVATKVANDFLQDSGLLITQFAVLVIIARAEGANYKQLAEDLTMDPTTLSRNLKPLEKSGYIEIHPGEFDARVKIVSLSAEGEAVLLKGFPLWDRAKAQITEVFGQDNIGLLLTMVSALHEISPD